LHQRYLVLQQIKKLISLKKTVAFLALLGLVFAGLASPLSAQNVTQGYSSDKVLQRGTVVSLDTEDTTKVVAATKLNQDKLHGVVVAPNDSSFTLSESNQKTFVASIGRFDTLVSTESGTIQPGDFLSISSVSGIVMKSGESDLNTIGKAAEGFDGNSNRISTLELKNGLGIVNTVAIGRIVVDIGVGPNPLLKTNDSSLPELLERIAEDFADKPVSPARIYISIIIILTSAGIAVSLLYSGTKSSMISIGRNPLSRKSISKSLLQIIMSSIIIFMIGLFGVYLLLRI
jgi:hypothetical protein